MLNIQKPGRRTNSSILLFLISDKDHVNKVDLSYLTYRGVYEDSMAVIRHNARLNIFHLCLSIKFNQIGKGDEASRVFTRYCANLSKFLFHT